MSITASCSHRLAEDEGPDGMGWNLTTAEFSRENRPSLLFGSYCTACRNELLREPGRVLATQAAEDGWCAGRGAAFGDWIVQAGLAGVNYQPRVFGRFRGHIDDIAFRLDTPGRTVLHFVPNHAGDGIDILDRPIVRDWVPVTVVIDGVQWQRDLFDWRFLMQARTGVVAYSEYEDCMLLFHKDSEEGRDLVEKQCRLQEVLNRLADADLAVLRENGLKA